MKKAASTTKRTTSKKPKTEGLGVIGELDRYLFGEGRHYQLYHKLGAHPYTYRGQDGYYFAVWAPHAAAVSLVGDFNAWNPDATPMKPVADSGIYELFVPGLGVGQLYKFAITTHTGTILFKADPYAFSAEYRPGTASVTADIRGFKWNDSKWMESRAGTDPVKAPISIYEVHLGSWKKKNRPEKDGYYTYMEAAHELADYVLEMGYTHVELMGIAEHPYDGSWGYQVTGYFAPTSRYGTPAEFMYFVNYLHKKGIGVILDWVPAHFPKDAHGLADFDGQALYEYADPRKGEHPDWGTKVFDYAKNEVSNFLIANALYWLDEYHIDGLRVDAVSQLIFKNGDPNAPLNDPGIWFLKNTNFYLQQTYPNVMLMAEDSSNYIKVTAPPQYGGLGFDYKWDLGWMNDTLQYLSMHPNDRNYSRHTLMFSMAYFYNDIFIMPQSHDEVVHGKHTNIDKMWGNYEQKFSQARLLYLYMCAHPGKVLNFMGNEIAEFREWDENKQLGWNLMEYPMHDSFNRYCQHLHKIGLEYRALYDTEYDPRAFRWLDTPSAPATVFAFVRRSADEQQAIACVMNFGLQPVTVSIPGLSGEWRELVNTDNTSYSGSGVINSDSIHGQVRLAPLSGCLLCRG